MLHIFSLPLEDTGVGYYRIFKPTEMMSDLKKAFVMSSEFTGGLQVKEIEGSVLEDASTWADVVFTNTVKTQEHLSMLMALRDYKKIKLVVDVDDNLINLNEDHPSYNAYMNPKLRISEWAQKSIMYADLVITTNEYLKELYYSLNKNIYVNPNSLNLTEIDKLKKKKNKKITIGWSGAGGHSANQELIINPIKRILKKYKNVEFVTFGEVIKGLPYKHQGFVPMNQYYQTYAKLGFDIVIAPLTDTRYNRGKSNLRLIEASSFGIPVVASPSGPYKEFPCLYADSDQEWYEQLELLILDEDMRKTVGYAGRIEVEEKYNIKKNSLKLLNEFEKLSEEKWMDKQKLKYSVPLSRKI